ncbi:MAG TPA: choice-of-anchor tandem repeat GloVer-containing protein [Rhizomicrobium sp.]|nr:choice-of-anchor tandem repeat GloVer-containing protein [Rhizomicrobium sp.]
MIRILDSVSKGAVGCGLAVALFVPLHDAWAKNARGDTVLYTFTGAPNDGVSPIGSLIRDEAGNFYGATSHGGTTACSDSGGCGTVFKLVPPVPPNTAWTDVILYNFCSQTNCADGAWPYAGVIADKKGNLYGTTLSGGTGAYEGCGAYGCGTVFKLAPDGTETVLHSFAGGSDGAVPIAGLIADKAGNLYGTTDEGGCGSCEYGAGTVFKIAPNGTETVLLSFNGSDGNSPRAGLIMDSAGNLYGTTWAGGANEGGDVFELAPDGTETVLYNFCSQPNCSDGDGPYAGLLRDSQGNLYGTTSIGGANGSCSNGCGTVFKLAPDGTETVLYNFCQQQNCADGADPSAALIADNAGNLYSTTLYSNGTVFKLAPNGSETVLHSFAGRSDGASPFGSLIMYKGNLYGTTVQGGDSGCEGGCGTIFEIKK